MKKSIKRIALVSMVAALPLMSVSGVSNAGTDAYLGEINYSGFNYAPRDTLSCNGQILAISDNAALFALLGNNYGGDGRTTFALPDLRGRVPVHQGAGPGLSLYRLGTRGGLEFGALSVAQMPEHSHSVQITSDSSSSVTGGAATSIVHAVSASGSKAGPADKYLAKGPGPMYSTGTPDVTLADGSVTTTLSGVAVTTNTTSTGIIGNTGASQKFSIMQPYTVVNCYITTNGPFPPRS